MKAWTRLVPAVVAGALLCAVWASPALSGEEICPMGGTQVRSEVDRDRAVAWAKEQRGAVITGADTADWSVLALSRVDGDIAIFVAPGYVFFGVAGRGGEVYPRDIERAFGKDLKKLREAMRKALTELWKAGAVKIGGNDVQTLADAAGLGMLAKEKDAWVLRTRECQPVDLPATGL
jgi:hypothetical protein